MASIKVERRSINALIRRCTKEINRLRTSKIITSSVRTELINLRHAELATLNRRLGKLPLPGSTSIAA